MRHFLPQLLVNWLLLLPMMLICQGCLIEESSLTSGRENDLQKCLLRQAGSPTNENMPASPSRLTGLKEENTAARERIQEKRIISLLILLGSDRAADRYPNL